MGFSKEKIPWEQINRPATEGPQTAKAQEHFGHNYQIVNTSKRMQSINECLLKYIGREVKAGRRSQHPLAWQKASVPRVADDGDLHANNFSDC